MYLFNLIVYSFFSSESMSMDGKVKEGGICGC